MAATEKLLWGGDWPIEVLALDGSLAPITGSLTILLSIRRKSDDYFLDFNDDTFKASGWTTREVAMTQVDATNAAGEYAYDWDTSAVTNEAADDLYVFRARDSAAAAKNLPTVGEILADGWVKDILDNQALQATAAALTALETHGDATWATATGFATAAALAALETHGDATWATAVGFATSAELAALETHGDATWATATGFATSVELAAAVSAIIAQGDAAWVTAVGFATPADVTAARDAILTQGGPGPWTTADLTGIATSAELAALETHGDATWATATGFATPANVSASTAAIIAQGDLAWITADLTGIATSVELSALETHGDATWATATGFATPGDAMTLTAAERTAIDAVLAAAHGSGLWDGTLSGAQAIQLQEVWAALGLNIAAPASYDATAGFIQALANVTPIDIAISILGTTVTLTRQP